MWQIKKNESYLIENIFLYKLYFFYLSIIYLLNFYTILFLFKNIYKHHNN